MPQAPKTQNPMLTFRLARGWDQTQASFALGVSKAMVNATERGYPMRLSRAIAEGMARFGEDAQAAMKAYQAWRAEITAELMAAGQAQANG